MPGLSPADLGLEAPRSVQDLEQLLGRFGDVLTPQNRALLQEVVSQLHRGSDPQSLQELAARMSRALQG